MIPLILLVDGRWFICSYELMMQVLDKEMHIEELERERVKVGIASLSTSS